jgi:hypothetical protein
MGGGNSHQRKMARRAEERIARKVADDVVQQIESRSATSTIISKRTKEPPRSLRERLGSFWGSTPIWGAIGVLIGAIVSQLSIKLLFIGVWVVVLMEFVRVGFFERTFAKVFGNIVFGLGLALVFFSVVEVFSKTKRAPYLRSICRHPCAQISLAQQPSSNCALENHDACANKPLRW